MKLVPPVLDIRRPCQSCGHTWAWRDDNGKCQHEIQDEDGTWMVCGCEWFRS